MKFAEGRKLRRFIAQEAGPAPIETWFVRSGHLEVVRMGEGDPIVLIPGLAGGWRLLVPLARRLSRTRQVLLVGLNGDRGATSAGGPVLPRDHAREIAYLLPGMGLERPLVFGVSYGGAVALELAVEHPSSVGGLMLMGAAARFPASLGATIARRILERFPLPHDSPFINQFFNLLHGKRPDSEAIARFVVNRCWETDQSVMVERLRGLELYDVADRLWKITAPTLVLAGTRDVIVPPDQQRVLAQGITGAEFVAIEEAGHVGFLTHRAAVSQQVGRFLRRMGTIPC